jgi:hypothetical protein
MSVSFFFTTMLTTGTFLDGSPRFLTTYFRF